MVSGEATPDTLGGVVTSCLPGCERAIQKETFLYEFRRLSYMSFLGLFLFKDVISLGVSFYQISYFGNKAILLENRGD